MDLSSDASESSLVEGLRAGEPNAFGHLMRAYAGRLHHVARRYVGAEPARDVVQETFTKAFASLHQFRGDSAIYTWLHQIAINTCLSQIRKSAIRKEQSIDELLPTFQDDGHRANPTAAWHKSTEDMMLQAETRKLVRDCIDQLPDNYRVVLLLRDIEGYGGMETAELLDISANAVKIRLHRARQALRGLLDPHMVDEK